MAFFNQQLSVVATTGVQLTSATTAAVNYFVTVTALTGNTKTVFIGPAIGVTTTNGHPLYPGQSATFPKAVFTDAAGVYVIAAADTQGVAFHGA
jgi:hypothetical protein